MQTLYLEVNGAHGSHTAPGDPSPIGEPPPASPLTALLTAPPGPAARFAKRSRGCLVTQQGLSQPVTHASPRRVSRVSVPSWDPGWSSTPVHGPLWSPTPEPTHSSFWGSRGVACGSSSPQTRLPVPWWVLSGQSTGRRPEGLGCRLLPALVSARAWGSSPRLSLPPPSHALRINGKIYVGWGRDLNTGFRVHERGGSWHDSLRI